MLCRIAQGKLMYKWGKSFQSVASNKKVRRLVHLTSLTSMKIQNLTEPLDGQTKLPLGQASWIGMSVAINSNRTIHNQQDFRQKRQWQDGFQVSMWEYCRMVKRTSSLSRRQLFGSSFFTSDFYYYDSCQPQKFLHAPLSGIPLNCTC